MPPTSTIESSSRDTQYAVHLFPPNSYSLPPPPPVVAHHVWILDCGHCGMFLTNRGMKAVLLLRPNVSLYSSDALPVNCSAIAPKPGAYTAPKKSAPLSSRTCECLTQSLSCHGCGQTVGYMIVIPCIRCTSSINASNRSTNGHRFVFHASEIKGTERHYVQNEPGVLAPDSTTSGFPLASPYSFFSPPYGDHNHASTRWQVVTHEYGGTSASHYLPTPPLDPDDPASSPEPSPTSETSSLDDYEISADHQRSESAASYLSSGSMPSLESMSFTPPIEAKESIHRPPTLKDGDLLFWHHLTRTGEIPGVCDDERARTATRITEKASKLPVVCGR